MKCIFRQFSDDFFRGHRWVYGVEEGPHDYESTESVADLSDAVEGSGDLALDAEVERRRIDLEHRITTLRDYDEAEGEEGITNRMGGLVLKQMLDEADAMIADRDQLTAQVLEEAEAKVDEVQLGVTQGINNLLGEPGANVAEHIRLDDEMQKMAAKGAWSGVETKYREMQQLSGVFITPQQHIHAAEAARSRGDMSLYRERLLKALAHAPDSKDVRAPLEAMQGSYVKVSLSLGEKYKGDKVLSRPSMPFAPDERKAVEFAVAQFDKTGEFHGVLPQGDYMMNDQPFTVEPGNPVEINLAPPSAEEQRAERQAEKALRTEEREAEKVVRAEKRKQAKVARVEGREVEKAVQASSEDLEKAAVFSTRLADAYRSGNMSGVEAFFQRINDLPGVDPSRLDFLYAADAAHTAGNADEAKSRYEQALALLPDEAEAGIDFQGQMLASIHAKFEAAS